MGFNFQVLFDCSVQVSSDQCAFKVGCEDLEKCGWNTNLKCENPEHPAEFNILHTLDGPSVTGGFILSKDELKNILAPAFMPPPDLVSDSDSEYSCELDQDQESKISDVELAEMEKIDLERAEKALNETVDKFNFGEHVSGKCENKKAQDSKIKAEKA